MVSLLMQVDLIQHIPPELYRTGRIAGGFIYLLERRGNAKVAPQDVLNLKDKE